MLELEMNIMGRKNLIHPTLFYNDSQAILVDAGMPGQLNEIREAVEKAGVSFETITAVILTHQDIDHVGSIESLIKELPKSITVYAHAEDKPYIEGEKEPIKMNRQRVAQMLEQVPAEMRSQVESIFLNPPQAKVNQTVEDGEWLPFFGGLQVIYTPGHTPGHISLYHRNSKTLVTGDAMVSENGKLLGPSAQATPDMEEALKSLKKFAALDIEQVVCYHGGLCNFQVNEQIANLVK